MNYALEHHLNQHSFLSSTPRKKVLKNFLVTIHNGMALIKLGKKEYALKKGESFWIPFDCLTSITYMPETLASVVDFSVRLRDRFPSQSGFVELPNVTRSAIEKLATSNVSRQQQNALLEVIRFEMTEVKPELKLCRQSEQFSNWKPDHQMQGLPKEIHLALKVREAKKRLLSGSKREDVIEALFNGSEADFAHLSQLVLGKSL